MEYNGFKIGDLDSLENKIFSTQKTVYDAPERAVEMLTIPGRNGAIALDQGRWENQPVTYRCGCYAESDEKFAERIAAFRSKLLLKTSYEILTDSYNPDEFRLGLYKNGLEADTVSRNHAGEFDVEFDCKPQRFLVSGNDPKTVGEWGETTKLSGDIVTFESGETDAFKSLSVEMEPVQDLNGYDHPWVGGAGKNKLPLTTLATPTTINGITWTVSDDGGITAKGTSTARSVFTYLFVSASQAVTLNGSYKGVLSPKGGSLDNMSSGIQIGDAWGGFNGQTMTVNGAMTQVWFSVEGEGTTVDKTIYPMIVNSSVTDLSYSPYENICPISGWDSVEVVVSPTTSAEDGTTRTATFDETVYGGTVDLVSGVLTIDRAMVTLDSSNVNSVGMSMSGGNKRCYIWGGIPTAKKAASTTEINSKLISNVLPTESDTNTYYGAIGISVGTNSYIGFVFTGQETTVAEVKEYISNNPLQFVYELATPRTIQLDPQTITTLVGVNNVWANAGAVTVEYGASPYIFYNDTGYPAKPLIVITGNGTVGVGKHLITVEGATSPVYIDCESMEIYTESGGIISGASSLVSFNTNEFPTLEAGANGVSVGSGISSVVITPRWWRL